MENALHLWKILERMGTTPYPFCLYPPKKLFARMESIPCVMPPPLQKHLHGWGVLPIHSISISPDICIGKEHSLQREMNFSSLEHLIHKEIGNPNIWN
jgi:hypothetical protein